MVFSATTFEKINKILKKQRNDNKKLLEADTTAPQDKAQDKAMIKKAMKQHDEQEHKGGKGTKLSLCKGGKAMKYASGGKASQLAKANGIAVKGKTKGKII